MSAYSRHSVILSVLILELSTIQNFCPWTFWILVASLAHLTAGIVVEIQWPPLPVEHIDQALVISSWKQNNQGWKDPEYEPILEDGNLILSPLYLQHLHRPRPSGRTDDYFPNIWFCFRTLTFVRKDKIALTPCFSEGNWGPESGCDNLKGT